MKYCPKCGADEIDVYVERILPENNGINMNKAECDCGWHGVACELVNEPPAMPEPVSATVVDVMPPDQPAPDKMTKAQLIEYLDAFNVEYSATAKKDELLALYLSEEAKHVATAADAPADPEPVADEPVPESAKDEPTAEAVAE